MKINESKLRKMTLRQEEVKISDGLKSCLTVNDGEEIKWMVKNLSYDEFQRIAEEVGTTDAILKDSLPDADTGNPISDALLKFIKACKDNAEGLTPETIKRICIFKYGTISPKVSHTEAVLISKHFALDFKNVVDRVSILSHMGSIPPGE